jgi:phospholipase/carboxylesterase
MKPTAQRHRDRILQAPSADPGQLILLFHGVGGTPRDMLGLGRRLRQEFPNAFVVAIAADHEADSGEGFQWYSTRALSDMERIARIEEAMPAFLACVQYWEDATGLDKNTTALIGFSQGGIMALESSRLGHYLAGRIVTIGSRYARLPETAPTMTTLHLFHGKTDAVMPYAHTITAAQQLLNLGADLTADVIPFLGHQITIELHDRIVERLRTHIPRRVWEEALRADSGAPAPGEKTH